MLDKTNSKHSSPLLLAFLTTITTVNFLATARGETADSQLAASEEPPQPQILLPPVSQKTGIDLPPQREEMPGLPPRESEMAAEAGSTPTPPASPTPVEPTGQESPASEEPEAPPQEPSETEEQPAPPAGQPPTTTEPAPAEEPRVLVVEIVVEGADASLENLIYNVTRTKPGRTATRSQLQEDVNAIYATGYFANVKVTPEDTPLGVRVTFTVQPNPVLREVIIETVPKTDTKSVLPPEVLEETFGEQYGKILNLRELQEGIKKLNEWYSTNGYDLAQVVGAPKVADDGIVTLEIAEGIVENLQVRFFDAEDEPVEGKTRDFIVTREMKLKPGDVFNRNIAQEDLQRLFALGLFEDVRLSFSPGTEPSEVVVNVDIVEGNTGSLAFGGGASTTAGLFGTISYQEQNLGGNRQTLAAEVQVGERELLFDLSFTDPWIGGDPYRTAYTANLFRRRSISLVFDGDNSSIRTFNGFNSPRVVRTGLGVTFARPLAKDIFTRPDWRLSLGLSYQNVRVENADGDLAPFSIPLNGFPPQQLAFNRSGVDDYLTLSFGASQDLRNNASQTTSGSLLRLGVEQGIPLNGSGNILFNRLRGNYSYYIPIDWLDFGFIEEGQPKPQTIAFNVQAGTVLGDLAPYEGFILGGSNSVRGYPEGEVGSGRSFFQATAEYRFPVLSSVGLVLFFDYGSNLGSQDAVIGFPGIIRGLPGWGYGYGAGVRIQSPVGPLRIDYGFNQEGDSRVHFGIGERF